MLQDVLEPGCPLCGFCSWLSQLVFAHYCGWLFRSPGTFGGMDSPAPAARKLRWSRMAALRNHAGLDLHPDRVPPSKGRVKMQEISYKQETLRAWHAPGVAWNTIIAV